MSFLGRIVRLQIQLDHLKQGEEPHRVYDPTPIKEVMGLWLSPQGVVAPTREGFVLDVHHADRPHHRNRNGANALSFGFTGSCARIRERFGPRLWDGIAGENILLEGDAPTPASLIAGVRVQKADGRSFELRDVIPAPPCAPFSCFLLGVDHVHADPAAVKETLRFLSRGMRGFYCRYSESEPAFLEPGDAFYSLSGESR
jgi:hypothetical protein